MLMKFFELPSLLATFIHELDGHHCQVNPQWMILMLMIGFFGFLSYEVLQYVSIYVQQI